MAWMLTGGAAVFLVPCVGAAVVGGLFAFHELCSNARWLRQGEIGCRAYTRVFKTYRLKGEQDQSTPRRTRLPVGRMTRRADPSLLYEHLEERRLHAVQRACRAPEVAGADAGRPQRLVPLPA